MPLGIAFASFGALSFPGVSSRLDVENAQKRERLPADPESYGAGWRHSSAFQRISAISSSLSACSARLLRSSLPFRWFSAALGGSDSLSSSNFKGSAGERQDRTRSNGAIFVIEWTCVV